MSRRIKKCSCLRREEIDPMRVVLLSEVYAKGMGYLENLLPKYLARLGVETHVVATDLSMSFRQNSGKTEYDSFVPRNVAGSVEILDGYTLHLLGHKRALGQIRMAPLKEKLASLRPDVVQTMTPIGWIGLDAALYKRSLGYQLFTGCHYHASVFPLARKKMRALSSEWLQCLAMRKIPGRLVSLVTSKCYAIAQDCADIAEKYFGVERNKIVICPLGVDSEIFHPVANDRDAADRTALRQRLGFAQSEIVCIYTGRFCEEKNPLVLAKAVERLFLSGSPYRGLFIGNGAQAEAIAACAGCKIHPFVTVKELGAFLRAADIGVWPAQESMSMLDAAACGLPIVANHTMTARERLDGNGLAYRLSDLGDLVRVLLDLRNEETRLRLGELGARKMKREYSWEHIARQRVRDYETALGSLRLSSETVVSE
jgi:glycosyltransferase involved in cell wall biosynthesis